jgi:hypothetical protein
MSDCDELRADLHRERSARTAADTALQAAIRERDAAVSRTAGMLGVRAMVEAVAREALLALVFDVEATLKLVDQLPEDKPSGSDVESLRQVFDHRAHLIHSELDAVDGAMAALMERELRRAEHVAAGESAT